MNDLLNTLNPFDRLLAAFKGMTRNDMQSQDSADRRNYGQGVRLWNDRDPRADQSFFLGSVPGFVLSNDQKIIDWNIAFEMVFGRSEGMKRGMEVGDWYKLIDNFRRLPNREAKLQGDALLPITDRERVVFLSPDYGRMVFMKLMSPVLDRISGRVIGWNVALNINSVHERVKFFEDLHQQIDDQSRHARYVAGAEQLLARSPSHQRFIQGIIKELGSSQKILILGAVKAEGLVEALLADGLHRQVTVADDDAESLRLVRVRCGRFHNRIRLVRRSLAGIKNLPEGRFDAAVIMYPRLDERELGFVVESAFSAVNSRGQVLVAGYNSNRYIELWWKRVQAELEAVGDIDTLRWHLKTVSEEDVKRQSREVATLDSEVGSPNWAIIGGARVLRHSNKFMGGAGSIYVCERAVESYKAV